MKFETSQSPLFSIYSNVESSNTYYMPHSNKYFGKRVNNMCLISETPHSVKNQPNCWEVRKVDHDDNNRTSWCSVNALDLYYERSTSRNFAESPSTLVKWFRGFLRLSWQGVRWYHKQTTITPSTCFPVFLSPRHPTQHPMKTEIMTVS